MNHYKKKLIQNLQRFDEKKLAQPVSIIAQEIGQRLFDRLDFIRLQPKTILDLGAGFGDFSQLLKKRFPKADIFTVDLVENRVRFVRKKQSTWFKRHPHFICADVEELPFADNSFDFIFSNLTLPWCRDLPKVFLQAQKILKPEGLFLFSTLGPDTLKELRQSWHYSVDTKEQFAADFFIDMHHLGDLLVQTQFADPVMDMEQILFTYRDLKTLFADLKNLDMHLLGEKTSQGLIGKTRWKKFLTQYKNFQTNELFPVNFEVIYGHAWKVLLEENTGEVSIPLSSIKKISANKN
jgi:malonyl-CoA O-methyltransferase